MGTPVIRTDTVPPAVAAILADEAASTWLRSALWSGLLRDPVDAARDAMVLADALEAWALQQLEHALQGQPERMPF